LKKNNKKEEPIQTFSFRLEVNWTPSQKVLAISMLETKNIITVYHHFSQKIQYDTLKEWKKNKRITRKKGSGRKVKSEELNELILN